MTYALNNLLLVASGLDGVVTTLLFTIRDGVHPAAYNSQMKLILITQPLRKALISTVLLV